MDISHGRTSTSDSSQISGSTGQGVETPPITIVPPNQQNDYRFQSAAQGISGSPRRHNFDNFDAVGVPGSGHSVGGDIPTSQTTTSHVDILYWRSEDGMWTTLASGLDMLLRQLYLHLLLRLPYVYFFRVVEIFEDSNLNLSEIKKMALETAFYNDGYRYAAPHETASIIPAQYKHLEESWNTFVDSLLRDWNTYNIVSALLLSAILTILQIGSAEQDPLIRYSLLFSQICALMSLLLGCLFSVRFDSSMRRTYKAAEWALEANKAQTNIWWNIWVLLAMPAVWLAWSIIFYLGGIMAFVWRTGAQNAPDPTPLTDTQLLIVRILITSMLGLGFVTGGLSLMTFRFYGRRMDQAWARRIQAWNMQQNHSYPTVHIPPPEFHPGDIVRSMLPVSLRRARSESSSYSERDAQGPPNYPFHAFPQPSYPAAQSSENANNIGRRNSLARDPDIGVPADSGQGFSLAQPRS
ncbi:hypothetical protein HYPSUDRAFT_172595 [Hypholoma sublateritium FD-334 SS-4]|uniref:Uncharacterized protein n=1 Tax=Hypholoma sublateritium (strain FD-334 SS-4) TaxID=945553 RepID=A0A0D2P4S4_HYPSF|nr:hypothetical protein HYPSUDRAFT_172595 [Hypholoma sublateritium FD-334 SS-4]